MNMKQASQLNRGSRVSYNDGRGVALATVVSVSPDGMCVQFDDRADTNNIRFSDVEWMKWMEVVEA